ncbi:MAG: methionyl-tRNA formyltransferase [Anaerococcus vaginalis]|uniref:methionyl-tRNA formyltransferase n=1 Tax=Anaerococcus vaginalis TaxID=33037 RepID=UPI002904B101|nr:methionyl-tRNA formyltransferase [Anaerococcus vaginalis]MDU2649388.1 methionyl-tRNA formyltransferase [Anaerococcus vaginalis]MDU4447299.1 methionyl-tRNA formyltransferase [Anaerococcus vaginalis]MDU7432822.1 methionyl-tRNA formyltransferase [Anaerococcus vaginalis]
MKRKLNLTNKINICFMGSPKFSLETLDILNKNENINLSLVVSGKDKKRNRNKFKPTVVKQYALDNNIEVVTPDSVNTDEFINLLKEKNIDYIVVVAFGQLIKEKLLEEYKNKIINLHPSSLPKYRGSSPVQFSLLNGDKKTHASAMLIEKGMDSGDILNQKEVEIKAEDDFTSLSEKLSKIGSEVILESVLNYDEFMKNRTKQDNDKATFTKKITKEMGKIDFNQSKEEIINKIRAFVEFPKAYFSYKNENVKILKASPVEIENPKISFVYKANKNDKIIIGCKNGGIRIEKIQFPGKKAMDTKSFLLGNDFEEGIYLG